RCFRPVRSVVLRSAWLSTQPGLLAIAGPVEPSARVAGGSTRGVRPGPPEAGVAGESEVAAAAEAAAGAAGEGAAAGMDPVASDPGPAEGWDRERDAAAAPAGAGRGREAGVVAAAAAPGAAAERALGLGARSAQYPGHPDGNDRGSAPR